MNTSDVSTTGDFPKSPENLRVSDGESEEKMESKMTKEEEEDKEEFVKVDLEDRVEAWISDELHLSGEKDDDDGDVEMEDKVEETKVLMEFDSKARVFDVRSDKEVRRGHGNNKGEKLTMMEVDLAKNSYGETDGDKRPPVSDFDSAYARVDEGAAARMSDAFGLEAEKALSYGFEPGDMVWGKVKSHPWWPGHVFSEAFATPSVRRTKHEGHVLVAFFGDSSYGWFDPAELISFVPHYAEKSRQTSSRNFLRAVEEAMDETSRRAALGLTCRCRNPYNFRPTSVRSYFAVDVPGYEPGAVYSVMQIKKARERFQSTDTLQFVQQLALMPMDFDGKNVESIQNKARILSFRKAAFEEFDETYAQAFGMQPVSANREETTMLDQIAKTPVRAPLSGPMVIAEALGGKKSTKSTKVKEQLKKDKYLFKRREDSNEPKSNHADASDGKPDLTGILHPSSKYLLPEAMDDFRDESLKFHDKFEDLEPQKQRNYMAFEDPDPVLEGTSKRDVLESVATPQLPIEAESPATVPQTSVDKMVKKTKARKRPTLDLNSEKSIVGEKKKKHSQFGTNSENSRKRLKHSKEEGVPKKSAGKSIGIGSPLSENSALDLEQKNNGSSSISPSSDPASLLQNVDLGNIEVEFPQVVNDMLALALDPFHGGEQNSTAIVLQVFLRFRSLVYQKSLVLPSASESDGLDSVAKPSASTGVAEAPFNEDVRIVPPKQPKHFPRPEDPTKAGRKRSLSDRQEEMSAKRLKKINHLKSMTAEKKAGSQKIPEVQREQKDTNVLAPSKPTKLDSVKKPELPVRVAEPAKVAEPAMLVLKFPQKTSLPSPAELKAKFGRFGPLDQSAMRVFWKTFTCRVVFQHKAHAQAAYKHAVRNDALFGRVKVNYQLRDVGGQALPATESVKWQVNGSSDTAPQFRSTGASVLGPGPGSRLMTPLQRSQQSNNQLKSCLKRPSGDEVGSSVSVSKESPRVKFMLGGEESNRGEQLMVSVKKEQNNIGSSADGGASSLAMDVNSKNLQKVLPQTLPPILPFPPRVQDMHETPVGHHMNVSHAHHSKVEPIDFKNYFYNTPTSATSPTMSTNNKKIDISHQMLCLMMRCNDVVTDLRCSLGYVPYHPL
ncbi:Pwwp domain-containing protein [Thalictrum thalictroides]|uniref:Pwwp domain-containing protein n=1 Tax=Thalictrum thalictroides TaxID=46969 RepID=A0A7J6US80_THATH|nr:Pwwp domain-containing protein [Thalictrum thalictroides]